MIKIESTEGVSLELLREVFGTISLGEHVEIDQSQYGFRSIDPPSWVRLLMDLEVLKIALGAGVAAYLTSIANEAGKTTWQSRSRLLGAIRSAPTKLVELARKVVTLQKLVDTPATHVEVGMPLNEGTYSAFFRIDGTTLEEVELQLVNLALHATSLKQLLGREGFAAVGWVAITENDRGGLVVSWMDRTSLKIHEEVLGMLND